MLYSKGKLMSNFTDPVRKHSAPIFHLLSFCDSMSCAKKTEKYISALEKLRENEFPVIDDEDEYAYEEYGNDDIF
jgi:hypothetical protein